VDAIFDVAPPFPSGAPAQVFEIRITRQGQAVSAKEGRTVRLPPFCAERHINDDGTFCLFWQEGDDVPIRTPEDAARWWELLLAFLRRQQSVTALRFWPGFSDARAHGDAARYQFRAQAAAAALGPSFAERLRTGRFSTRARKHLGRRRIKLIENGVTVAAVVFDPTPKLMTLRAPCKCDQGARIRRPVRSCADHARVLADFIVALDQWQAAEEDFYNKIKLKKLTCCGTVDNCPLAA
jgi:hypothetical protein